MTTALVPQDQTQALAHLAELREEAQEFIRDARSENTRKAYRADWQHFAAWCEAAGRDPLPAAPETVALYVAALARVVKPSTIQRRLVGISQAHKLAGHPSPTSAGIVREVWKGLARRVGTAQEGKAPAVLADVRRMVETCGGDLLGLRDAALLLVGFGGAFRRSELAALDRSDVRITADGLQVTLRRSKTDQEGQGRPVGIVRGRNPETCPVRALEAWLSAAGITEGPLFRGLNRHGQLLEGRFSDKGVARVVKARAEAAGLDPARYAGHSLRAGMATTAAAAGASERSIMKQTGHKSERMVRKYIREGALFRDNASATLGL